MKNEYKKSFLLLIIIPFISYTGRYLFNLMLARTLPDGLYGDFTIGIKTLTICSIILLMGTATTSNRFLSSYLNLHDEKNIIHYTLWNLKLILKSSIFFLSFLIIFLVGMVLSHVFSIKDISSYHIAFYMIFLSPLGSIAILLASYLQSNKNIVLYNLISQSGIFFIYLAVILFINHTFQPSYTNRYFFLTSIASYFILILIEVFLLLFFIPHFLKTILLNIKSLFNIQSSLEWKKTANNLIISQIIFVVLCSVDLYSIKLISNNASWVNQYSAILTITVILWLVSNSIISFLSPEVSTYIKENNLTGLKTDYYRVSLINAIVSGLVCVGIIFFGKTILSSFGSSYVTINAYFTLIIVVIGFYIGSLSRPISRILANSGDEKWLVYSSTLEFFIIIILAPLLTWFFGMIGTAFASLISISVKTLFFFILLRLRFSIKALWII